MAEVYDHFAFLLTLGEDIVKEELSQPEITYVPLEEVVDFESSSLLDPDAPYHPGPEDRDYLDELRRLLDEMGITYWDELDEW
jgi:hypothetical protein